MRPDNGRNRPTGLTLIELLVVVLIIAVLASVGWVHYQHAQTRAKVAAGKSQLRNLGGAIEIYRVDQGRYPFPYRSLPNDPLGVFASTALRGLTTPVAYVGPGAFRDPFGELRVQIAPGSGLQEDDPFRPPEPGGFNADQSMIYIDYPAFSGLTGNPAMNARAYTVISIGPDLRDSFITYFPFPESLPASAAQFGILRADDTVYDPTNGAVSGGDLAWFGGELSRVQLIGGGQ
jgi:prepilin-type N-terminal cleavage/methylation domain-containing protein